MIDNISAPFIRRPVATTLLAVAILLSGIAAYTQLAVAPLPRVDVPTISVSANLPGASPETMATAVAMPLERRFGRIAGVKEITSQSTLGTTNVTVQFELDRDQESCARDIQAAINAAAADLPPNLPAQPRYRKVNPSDSPILILSLQSTSLPLPQVFEAANTVLAQKIAQVSGVGQVGVGGGVQPAVRVQVDPMAIAALGISMEDVRAAMSSASSNSPRGGVGDVQWHAIDVDSQLVDAANWQQLVVRADPTGGLIRLGDIATVSDDVENQKVAGWFDGNRTVSVIVRREPGANILDTIDRVKALLPELAQSISPAIQVHIALDRATTIRASVEHVEHSLLISIGLVILVVFAFLRSVRATAVASVVVPLSLVATFGVMWMLDYSIDNLSLMALTIATGFVVDDAIVVTENIVRFIERGKSPLAAALEGTKQIGFTIVSITASLLAVFIPLLAMGGQVGMLFREFSVVLAIAIAVSAVISLTLAPMLCAKLLQPSRHVSEHVEHGWIVDAYAWLLRGVLRFRHVVLVLTLGLGGLTIYLFSQVQTGLFPAQDTGMITGSTLAPQDISFPAMYAAQRKLNGIIGKDPDVAHFVSNLGGFGSTTGNSGSMFIQLREMPPRTASAEEVIARIRKATSKIEGIQFFMRAVQDVQIGGRFSRTAYQYTLESADLAKLDEWVPKVAAALRKLPQLKDVNSDQQNSGLQLVVEIDRDAAARFGITPAAIDNTLYSAFGQRQVATYFTEVNQYRVVLEAHPSIGDGPEALDRLFVTSTSGAQVPLAVLVTKRQATVALSIAHQGQFPSTTISFNLSEGVALGEAVAAVEKTTLGLGMPASIHGSFSGTAQAFRDSLLTVKWLVVFALLAVYIVLGVLYESYVHPITILSTIPSAGLGALLALLVTDSQLDLIAMVGLVLLVGIVKKNAILMIDFALELEREGKAARDAIYEAARMRFRPILMTTLAALFGALPLAVGGGIGSELRRPLGIAIVGGLIVSQVLTLFTTPVVYLALHRFTRKRRLPRS